MAGAAQTRRLFGDQERCGAGGDLPRRARGPPARWGNPRRKEIITQDDLVSKYAKNVPDFIKRVGLGTH